jgi:hypothetical protein
MHIHNQPIYDAVNRDYGWIANLVKHGPFSIRHDLLRVNVVPTSRYDLLDVLLIWIGRGNRCGSPIACNG